MKRILIFTEYYYPGFKAGGPIQSVYNIANSMAPFFEVYVVCRDRDSGDLEPYNEIKVNSRNKVGDHFVYYISPQSATKKNVRALISKINPSFVYLNSFFSRFSSLVFRMLISYEIILPVLIAPRGEFNEAALNIKKRKKKLYLSFFKFLLFRRKNIYWQATSQEELDRIRYTIGEKSKKFFLPGIGKAKQLPLKEIEKKPGEIKIVTVARIHRIKNLMFFLEILEMSGFSSKVNWDIFGLIEDKKYHRELLEKAETISCLSLNFKGEIPNEKIHQKLPEYHLFVLPTLGENFGHAIYDAIISGLPLIISNKTPWLGLSEKGIGYDLPLTSPDLWIQPLKEFLYADFTYYHNNRKKVYDYGTSLIKNDKNIEKYKQIFNQLSS